jgi:hypothetical protein
VTEDELSHKGIHRETQIDKTVIESNEYRRKFDNATDNAAVNKTLYNTAKAILNARSGSRYESMRWIDGDTGGIIAHFDKMGNVLELTGEEHELKVEYPDSLLHRISGHNNIIVIHNHPNSSAPSVGDFNSMFTHKYKVGFVVAHNGRVFKYSSQEEINSVIYYKYWQRYIGQHYEEVEAQIIAIKDLSRNINITFEEVLKNDLV